jgi:tRNA-2-methylthio-N6-dimethylallyladenosine synthase
LGPDLPDELKFERLARLNALQKVVQERRNRRWVGRSVKVLVEGPNRRNQAEWTGRTPEARWVHFEGRTAPGRVEDVRVGQSSAYSLRGEIICGA